MLQHTFRHVPGVGPGTESKMWAQGFDCWEKARCSSVNLRGCRPERLRRLLEESEERLAAMDIGYFSRRLPSGLHWRFFPEFRGRAAYLDIETMGLCPATDPITTIALYDGKTVRHYVLGRNLDAFADDVLAYDLLVTYNGKCFDVPFIRQSLGIELPQAHIDLRYVLKSLGYGGGLKGCERRLGFARPGLEDVDGFFAVLLWEEYERTFSDAVLETLLAYNVEDVLSLERLLVFAYNQNVLGTPFAGARTIPPPKTAANPFRPHPEVIRRIRRRMHHEVG